jgi:hypothetical protein
MSLTSYWNVTDAFKLRPGIGSWVVSPDITEPGNTVCAAEKIQLLIPRYDRVVRTCWGNLSMWRAPVNGILDQCLPSVAGLLQCVKVKRDQIVEEEALNLTTENIYLGTNNVQRVAITTWRAGACRSSSRPLLGGYQQLARTQDSGLDQKFDKRTGVQQVEGIIEHIGLVCFCVSSKDDKSISDKQGSMSNSRTRALGSGRNRITAQIIWRRLDHPEITLDGRAVYQTTHDVDGTILGRKRIGGGAITRKRMVGRYGEVQVSLGPGIG